MKKTAFFPFPLFFLFLSNNIIAQTNLITYNNASVSTVLNANELGQYQKIAMFPEFSSTQLIQINTLASSINANGNLQVDLSDDDCGMLEFEPKTTRFIDEQNYYYYGLLKDPNIDPNSCVCTCTDGEIMIESREGRKYGHVVVDDKKYNISSLGQSYSVMGKVNSLFFANKQECKVSVTTNSQNLPKTESLIVDRTDNCKIRVLFLYTQAAEDKFGANDLIDKANTAISQTNQAFLSSAILNTSVELANVLKLTDFNENPNKADKDLDKLRTYPLALSLRDGNLADIVALITDGDYDVLGLAPLENLGNPMGKAFGFLFVEGKSIMNNTFSHEFGHVIGCRHQKCSNNTINCDDDGSDEHGSSWGHRPCWFCNWKNYGTIMHTLGEHRRLLNYSNPNVSIKGHPTGVVNERDNAKWIRDNACLVSSYLPSPVIPLSASISGEKVLCNPYFGDYYADVTGSDSPFSFDWRVSTDGVNWGNTIGNNQYLTINSNNYPLNSIIFLRVKVQDANGNSVFTFYSLKISNIGTPECDYPLAANGGNGILNIYPNPIKDELLIEFEVEIDNSPVELTVLNNLGQQLHTKHKQYSKGKHTETFDLKNVQSSILTLKTNINSREYASKIVKMD